MKLNPYLEITAEECDVILGARFELAAKYGWMGRTTEAYDALTTARLLARIPCEYADRLVERQLLNWDRYNDMVQFIAEKRATKHLRSAPWQSVLEMQLEWQATHAA